MNKTAMYHPKRGVQYTVDQIYKELKLDDSPFLCFDYETIEGVSTDMVIQDSYVVVEAHTGESTEEKPDRFGDLKFEYRYTTDEWIPIFQYRGDIAELVKHLNFGLVLSTFPRDGENAFCATAWLKTNVDYRDYYTLVDGQLVGAGEVAKCESEEYLQRLIETNDRFNAFIKGVTA